jgi:hypothetical protein
MHEMLSRPIFPTVTDEFRNGFVAGLHMSWSTPETLLAPHIGERSQAARRTDTAIPLKPRDLVPIKQ